MSPTAVFSLNWALDSLPVGHEFRLHYHINWNSWTLAFCANCLFHLFHHSEVFSTSVVSIVGLMPTNIKWVAPTNWGPTTCLRKLLLVVFDCLLPITSRPSENLAYTLTPCGMIENISHPTVKRLCCLESVCSCWRPQSVRPNMQNVMLNPIGLEW